MIIYDSRQLKPHEANDPTHDLETGLWFSPSIFGNITSMGSTILFTLITRAWGI